MMATSATETASATKLKLDPPEALQAIAPAEAAGLVPLKADETSELDGKVAKFIDREKPERDTLERFVKEFLEVEGMDKKDLELFKDILLQK